MQTVIEYRRRTPIVLRSQRTPRRCRDSVLRSSTDQGRSPGSCSWWEGGQRVRRGRGARGGLTHIDEVEKLILNEKDAGILLHAGSEEDDLLVALHRVDVSRDCVENEEGYHDEEEEREVAYRVYRAH